MITINQLYKNLDFKLYFEQYDQQAYDKIMLKSAFYKKINHYLFEVLSEVPAPSEKLEGLDSKQIDLLIRNASLKAAAISGSLSLPSGPFAVITILPDLVAVWKIQAQLVADIASVNAKTQKLTRESMMYCLFGNNGTGIEDLVIRVGERFVVKKSSQKVFQGVLGKIGLRIGRVLLGERIARWIPLIGAGLVARYSFNDTQKVGKTARIFFASEINLEN